MQETPSTVSIAMRGVELIVRIGEHAWEKHPEPPQRLAINITLEFGYADYFDKHEAPFFEKVGNPGDGHGALIYLEEARQALKDANAPVPVQEAIDRAVIHVSDAVDHARESVHGTGITQTHSHADKVAALLVAGHGKGDTDSPVTGTLAYAMKQVGLKMSK